MELRNADGRIAEMSGNGIRCLAWVANREGLGSDGHLVVDTGGGRRTVAMAFGIDAADLATVDMGAVTFEPAEIPLDAPSPFGLEATFHGVTYEGDAAGVGNPHFVLFVDDVDAARVTQHGPHLEHDERFPNGTNVEFVQVVDRGRLRMRVWERGVGETLSCGTGVCATSAVARRRDLVDASVLVDVPGGEHLVTLGETVHLGGEVQHVFDADVDEHELVRRLT
jgi:diaminopimelate epimerase